MIAEMMPEREQRQLEAVAHPALLEHGREHVLDPLLLQSELPRQLLVGPPSDDAADHIALARRQDRPGRRHVDRLDLPAGVRRRETNPIDERQIRF